MGLAPKGFQIGQAGQAADRGRGSGALGQSAEGTDLRILLELRRRLKSAAEKELCVGTERVRWLRGELRRTEAELRLCAGMLRARTSLLSQARGRVDSTRVAAERTCSRLSSLERENDDLAQQLSSLQQTTMKLQQSVGSGGKGHYGTLDSFSVAASALNKQLQRAGEDQAVIRTRTRDLVEETAAVTQRASRVHACLQLTLSAIATLCEEITRSLEVETSAGGAPTEVGAVTQAAARVREAAGQR